MSRAGLLPSANLCRSYRAFSKMEKERVTVFIDGSNFYHGLKNCIGRTDIDFLRLGQKLCGKRRKLIRVYYYNAVIKQEDSPEGYKKQQRFFNKLYSVPYFELKLGRLESRRAEDGSVYYIEKGTDINLAVDMMKYAYNNAYDTAVIVSGDGDFVNAVKAVKDLGKHVEHAYFESGHSHHLRQAADKHIRIDQGVIGGCLVSSKEV